VSVLLASPQDADWFRWIIVAVFFLLPVIGRVVRSAMGKDKDDDEKEVRGQARERWRRLREERRQSETEGEDLWRRLARGEVSSPPPRPPRSLPVPAPVPQAESLELEEEPAPLAMLGDVSEPGEAPEVALEREAEPAPFAPLAEVSAEEPAGARLFPRLALARSDLRRAIVLSEVLAPPVSERALRA